MCVCVWGGESLGNHYGSTFEWICYHHLTSRPWIPGIAPDAFCCIKASSTLPLCREREKRKGGREREGEREKERKGEEGRERDREGEEGREREGEREGKWQEEGRGRGREEKVGKVSKVEGRKKMYLSVGISTTSHACVATCKRDNEIMSSYMYKYKLSLICCHWHCCTIATMPDDNKVTTVSCLPLSCGDTCMNFGKQWEAFIHTVGTLYHIWRIP